MQVEDRNDIPRIINELKTLKELKIEIGVFGSDDSLISKIATVHEFGATIKPKNVEYLTIPSKHAKGRKAREIQGLYRPIGRGRKPLNILVVNGGPEPNQYGNTVMFYLSKGVKIPERSYFRSTFDENANEWSDYALGLVDKILNGTETARGVAEKLGARIQRDVQRTIRELSSPSNAPVTVARKGTDNPLIDTGRLRQSVTYRVV